MRIRRVWRSYYHTSSLSFYLVEDVYGKRVCRNRLGRGIVRELNALDMDVMAIDSDENRVNEYSDIATHAVVADTTDEAVMKSLGIRNFDHVIVAIGENIQSSTLTTLILKELGVKR